MGEETENLSETETQESDSTEVIENEEVNEEQVTEQVKEFTNPNDLPPELVPAFKKMQASFTRAMQGVSGDRKKIELYDNLMTNPENTVRNLAAQVGLQIVDGKAVANPASDVDVDENNETVKWIKKIIQKELAPTFKNFQAEQAQIKAQTGIAYLDKTHPDWYLYEDVMTELVTKHPTLGTDLDTLYETAKQTASRVVNMTKAAAKTSSNITKPSKGSGNTVVVPSRAKTIEEAFNIALKQHKMA